MPASHADKDFDHLLSMLQISTASEATDSSAAAPGAMSVLQHMSAIPCFLPSAFITLIGVQCIECIPCPATISLLMAAGKNGLIDKRDTLDLLRVLCTAR